MQKSFSEGRGQRAWRSLAGIVAPSAVLAEPAQARGIEALTAHNVFERLRAQRGSRKANRESPKFWLMASFAFGLTAPSLRSRKLKYLCCFSADLYPHLAQAPPALRWGLLSRPGSARPARDPACKKSRRRAQTSAEASRQGKSALVCASPRGKNHADGRRSFAPPQSALVCESLRAKNHVYHRRSLALK